MLEEVVATVVVQPKSQKDRAGGKDQVADGAV
jgi:hypothetical protein